MFCGSGYTWTVGSRLAWTGKLNVMRLCSLRLGCFARTVTAVQFCVEERRFL